MTRATWRSSRSCASGGTSGDTIEEREESEKGRGVLQEVSKFSRVGAALVPVRLWQGRALRNGLAVPTSVRLRNRYKPCRLVLCRARDAAQRRRQPQAMDQHRGLADDLIYGRDLDHRPDETPLSERPEFAGAAGVSHRRGEFSYDSAPAWSTSNALAHPREVAMRDPLNPASRPYAGVRTSLTFRSASAEMPAHMHAFVARDFSELKQVEEVRARAACTHAKSNAVCSMRSRRGLNLTPPRPSRPSRARTRVLGARQMRQRSVELNHEETLKEQNQVELFEAAIQLKARTLRTRFDYLNAGNDGLVNVSGCCRRSRAHLTLVGCLHLLHPPTLHLPFFFFFFWLTRACVPCARQETGDFNDFTHAGKDTLSAIRI